MCDARWATVILTIALGIGTASGQDEATATEKPRDVGLIEQTGRGLVQLDVTVTGPPDQVADLGPADFDLAVNGRAIESFLVDRMCRTPATDGTAPAQVPGAVASVTLPAAVGSASYLFYFDQHHLTMAGRQNAIDLARTMIPELVRGGDRAAIVSSGKGLDTLADLTDDVATLLDALDRLEGDRALWDSYPQLEELRIRDVVDALGSRGIEMACSLARQYQIEEAFRTDKALRLFSMVLGHLAELDPPKVAIYFADTVRKQAGAHYYTYVGRCSTGVDADTSQGMGADHALDRTVAEASSHGIRLYTVQAQGLVTGESISMPGMAANAGLRTNSQRISQAQDSLSGLALETGGRAFLNGVAAPKMVERIREDLDCLYLLSFDRGDLPEDSPLRVVVRALPPKVRATTRGRLVLQSDGARRTSRILASFAAPGSVRADVSLRGALVPLGFAEGRYRALLQIHAPGSPLAEAAWDIGASIVSHGEFHDDLSTRVGVDRPGVPIVLERVVTFRPGPYEVIAVAHETVADLVGTVRLAGEWPQRTDGPALGPVAVLQPVRAAFTRDEVTRSSGALAHGETELLDPALPTALIGLVCRGSEKRQSLTVERVLRGEASHGFEPLTIEIGEERCVQFRDLIGEGTLTAGRFTYDVRVMHGDEVVATTSRAFAAVSATPIGDAARR